MSRRLNTVIIVPHNKAKFVKFTFSSRSLIISTVAVLSALTLSLVAIAFTGSAVGRRAEVQRLASENQQLADVNRQLERTVADVQARLDEFEERTARLALAAGMEVRGEGVGGLGNPGGPVGSGGTYTRLPEPPESMLTRSDWILKQLGFVEDHLDEQDRVRAGTPSIAPVKGIITDGFGRRRDPFTGRQAFHRGLDLSARRGTPVASTGDGVVVFAGRNGGLGKIVRISHGFGYTTVYGHLDKILVQPGDEVHRGDEIGLLGNTGRSTGPHLHYEIHADGRAVNPLYYILNAL